MSDLRHRVWSGSRKKFADESEVYQDGSFCGSYNEIIEPGHGEPSYMALVSGVDETEILERCTGRRDMDGDLMYAGDIIRFTLWWFDGNVAETQLTGTLVYSPELMSFQLRGVKNNEWESHTGYNGDQEYLTPFSELNFEEADFKVIGNIHENPELLSE